MTKAKWYNSLRVQIVMLLTLALLPLGAVAIYQTDRVESQSNRNAELALLALTGRAAKEEARIIESAFGIARFFGSVAEDFVANPELCTPKLSAFLTNNQDYKFIGIVPKSGLMTCSSADEVVDFSGHPDFASSMEAQTRFLTSNLHGPISGDPVSILSEPFYVDSEFAGFISISTPHSDLPNTDDELNDLGLVELITINSDGAILSARNDLETAQDELPSMRSPQALHNTIDTAFLGTNQLGEQRTYTIAPVQGSPISVLAAWHVDDGLGDRLGRYIQPAVFPILMWFASMAVAMLSIHTLVLRHINRLRINMDGFADRRTIETSKRPIAMPSELQELSDNFNSMTDVIMREEAALEDTLREKNVLIKEVHHRVKNNLQLISSIMNMQIRTAEHDETKLALSRLQDRVLSLAMIHRDLYQSRNGGLVDVGALVAEIVEKTIEVAVPADFPLDVTTDFDRVWLYPDQAVPLSLMVAEAITNAVKYLGVAQAGSPWIKASLKQDGAECILTLSNSIGNTQDVESTGLGAQLINAFSIQLGGKMKIDEAVDHYKISLHFKVEDFLPDARDF